VALVVLHLDHMADLVWLAERVHGRGQQLEDLFVEHTLHTGRVAECNRYLVDHSEEHTADAQRIKILGKDGGIAGLVENLDYDFHQVKGLFAVEDWNRANHYLDFSFIAGRVSELFDEAGAQVTILYLDEVGKEIFKDPIGDLILLNLDRMVEEFDQNLLPRVLREVALSVLHAVNFGPVTRTGCFVDRCRLVEQVFAAQIRLLLQVLQEGFRHIVVH